MGQEQYKAMMPIICADLVRMIAVKQNISDEEAIAKLYSSEFYTVLERENTKVWQYSTEMLCSLFEQEEKNGHIIYPDV